MTQTQVQATYLETLPIKGALQGLKDVYAYRGHRYSLFYHPIYACYQIGVAAPHKAAWGLLGRNWLDVLTTHAATLEAAHALAQAEIDRMVERAAR